MFDTNYLGAAGVAADDAALLAAAAASEAEEAALVAAAAASEAAEAAAAAAAGASGAGAAGVTTTVGAGAVAAGTTISSVFLLHAVKAMANREAIKRVFFMRFSFKDLTKFCDE
ncbi:MAG: hypothetical protein H7315_21235 [Herminiimonas sp.]|nr:hypothetical protein [Herminiimonas sp.]